MAKEMNLLKRMKAPTPPFFKRIGAIGVTLVTISATIIGAPATLAAAGITFVLPNSVATIAAFLGIGGAVMKGMAKLTMVENIPEFVEDEINKLKTQYQKKIENAVTHSDETALREVLEKKINKLKSKYLKQP